MTRLLDIESVLARQQERLSDQSSSHDNLLDIATVVMMTVGFLERWADERPDAHPTCRGDTQIEAALRLARGALRWVQIHGMIAPRAELLARVIVATQSSQDALNIMQHVAERRSQSA